MLLLVPLIKARATDIIYTKEDSLIYEAYIKEFSSLGKIPVNELLIKTAKYFLTKPYVASTLEITDDEKLVINLREFDCTTFVETCLALSLTIKSEDHSFAGFCNKLTSIRYRNNEIEGYPSRLHYMTEWIYQNEKKGILNDLTVSMGGNKVSKKIDFMTTHTDAYKHLKNSAINTDKMREIEDGINRANSYSIIKKSLIHTIEPDIKDGDIIVFATSIGGLDYSHIGIAYWESNNLHFIHASSKYKKVVIEKQTLEEYCLSSKSCTGISVLRVN